MGPARRGPWVVASALAVVFWIASAAVARWAPPLAFPPLTRPVMGYFEAQDMAMVINGARRFGADFAYIQMMQYYGSHENADPHHPRGPRRSHPVIDEHDEHEGHVHMGAEGSADANAPASGAFPQLAEYAFRIGSLDPKFHYAYLFVGGALGFNLNRTDEAVAVLEDGGRKDPSFWKYRMYQGAIAYRKNQEVDKVVASLEMAVADPDCPSMIKNILAHIYIKQGRVPLAMAIYRRLLASRDKDYVEHASQQLEKYGYGR